MMNEFRPISTGQGGEAMATINQLIASDRRIVVLTGAGVSVPSGIPPFRGSNGLYKNADVERLLSIDYFIGHPKAFWTFYRSLFDADLLLGARPNAVHRWLAGLERTKRITIVTQNIDGLHRKAGSRRVIEMHGAFAQVVCPKCGAVYQMEAVRHEALPRCTKQTDLGTACGAVLKPDIVLFGEAVRGFEESVRDLRSADRLLVLGSSLAVAPANLLPEYASMSGVPVTLINDRPAVLMDGINTFVRTDFVHFDPDRGD